MRMVGLIACVVAMAAGQAFADTAPLPPGAPKPDPAAACAHLTCRTVARDLALRDKDGTPIHLNTATVPYVDDDGRVALYAGETVEISFPDRADLSHPKFVRVLDKIDETGVSGYRKDAAAPTGPATLMLQLKQDDGKPDMMLLLRNDTGVPLKYDAEMFVPTAQGVDRAHTSTCMLLPGTMGFESWPHPVAMLLLSGFHKVEPTQMRCD
jgi:hypothetical protein